MRRSWLGIILGICLFLVVACGDQPNGGQAYQGLWDAATWDEATWR